MTLLDRHIEFVEALRQAGLPVSLAEGLDAAEAMTRLDISDRETLRAGYAATVVKRQTHRPGFDTIFDLYFPSLIGEGSIVRDEMAPDSASEGPERLGLSDNPQALADFREQLADALAVGDDELLGQLAREAVQRFGLIRGRQPGEQRWSSYNVMNRVSPGELIDRVLKGLLGDLDEDPATRRAIVRQLAAFERLVDSDVRRRAAEVRGAAYVARTVVRPSIENLDFTSARKSDLVEMRREIYPLARRLATRLSKEKHSRQRGALDFRRTVRASISTGGVPMTTHHKPKRPGRTDLVVLCDVSGSVANFANFTLMLVYALREQFHRVRAFTFVDEIHEVTDHFEIGADPIDTMASLAASAEHASLWGRTNYGRAFTRFSEKYAEALTPRTNLLVLGDARSNYSDLALPVVKDLVYQARHSWWLNPEHQRHWDTGDSAARQYAELIAMKECRNLTQLGEFVHDLA
ncbi:MAG: hypothetical protein JWR35_2087 [Marmoricola sp.]|jgi:uncharacterized protein with von Willebrand factor type A (vWA) domain|nr:hypothetical protein [Marmoricola sp.]